MRISREILHLEHVVLKRNAYLSRNTVHGKCKNAYFSRIMALGASPLCRETRIYREIRHMDNAKSRISREIRLLEHVPFVATCVSLGKYDAWNV